MKETMLLPEVLFRKDFKFSPARGFFHVIYGEAGIQKWVLNAILFRFFNYIYTNSFVPDFMNKKLFPALLLSSLFMLALFSCKKESENKYGTDLSRGYYPLDFGRYVVYDVDSTIWDDFHQVKTVHKYQMRYTVADTFRDNTNRLSYRIDVHIRKTDTFEWQPHRVINVTPTTTSLELSELNLRYIKLVFPVANNIEWKGNSLIPAGDQDYQYFQDWTYQYTGHEEPFNDGKSYFDNTITVLQTDQKLNDPETMPDNFAELTYSKEVYGFDIGMVYREMTRWTYDPTQSKFRKGYSVVMRAVDHN